MNELYESFKRQIVILDKKQDPVICSLHETNFQFKGTDRLKVKDGKRCIMQTASTRKLEWLAVLRGFKTKPLSEISSYIL